MKIALFNVDSRLGEAEEGWRLTAVNSRDGSGEVYQAGRSPFCHPFSAAILIAPKGETLS